MPGAHQAAWDQPFRGPCKVKQNIFLDTASSTGYYRPIDSRDDFRVVRHSVQRDHLHLIVEADDKKALSRGMRGLAIRCALAVNRALGRRGALWGDRYHASALRTPRMVRNALVYVLANAARHLRAVAGLDPCSSAPWFDGFHDAVATRRR